MSNLNRSRATGGLAFLVLVVVAIAAAPLLSGAAKPAATLTVVNNSSKVIRHLYLSPTTQENWGGDQLTSAIAPGGSVTLNNACSGADVKVIAEDQDGCFLYQIVSCTENSTWTITNSAVPDCGS